MHRIASSTTSRRLASKLSTSSSRSISLLSSPTATHASPSAGFASPSSSRSFSSLSSPRTSLPTAYKLSYRSIANLPGDSIGGSTKKTPSLPGDPTISPPSTGGPAEPLTPPISPPSTPPSDSQPPSAATTPPSSGSSPPPSNEGDKKPSKSDKKNDDQKDVDSKDDKPDADAPFVLDGFFGNPDKKTSKKKSAAATKAGEDEPKAGKEGEQDKEADKDGEDPFPMTKSANKKKGKKSIPEPQGFSFSFGGGPGGGGPGGEGGPSRTTIFMTALGSVDACRAHSIRTSYAPTAS